MWCVCLSRRKRRVEIETCADVCAFVLIFSRYGTRPHSTVQFDRLFLGPPEIRRYDQTVGDAKRQCWHRSACSCSLSAPFLANVNMLSPVRLSSVVCLSVCNVRVPYSGGLNFPQYFYGIWYLGHPLTSAENFTEIVPGEPLRRGS